MVQIRQVELLFPKGSKLRLNDRFTRFNLYRFEEWRPVSLGVGGGMKVTLRAVCGEAGD